MACRHSVYVTACTVGIRLNCLSFEVDKIKVGRVRDLLHTESVLSLSLLIFLLILIDLSTLCEIKSMQNYVDKTQ